MCKPFANWLKKYFIPHKGNDHQPHILRRQAVLIFLAVIIASEIFFLAQTLFVFKSSDFLASILPGVLVELTNNDRKIEGVSGLKINEKLQAAAQMKANDMASKRYFSHTSPEGLTPWYWFEKAGYSFRYAGENLAVNFFDSNDVNSAWMNSSSHKENIVNARFTEIGIGIAKGMYQGRESIFIVQLFGSPVNAPKKTSNPVRNMNKNKGTVSSLSSVTPVPKIALSAENKAKEIGLNSKVEGTSSEAIPDSSANPVPLPRLSEAERLFSMPRLTTNYIFISLLAIIFAALTLKIMIKIRIQYPHLILNGALLLLVISLLLFFNKYINIVNAAIF